MGTGHCGDTPTMDGLCAGEALRVPESEMEAALNSASRDLRVALEAAAGNIGIFASAETLRVGKRKAGPKARAVDTSACFGGMLRAGRTLSSAFNFADDRDSGTGRRGEGHSRGFRRGQPTVTLAAAALLECGVLPHWGAQAIAALAYGTKTVPRVNKIVDREFVCDYGEENRLPLIAH